MSLLEIRLDELTGPEIAQFLQDHLDDMHSISPPESVHALDLNSLRSTNIAFWTAWQNDELVASGALKELDSTSGEIKSMRTSKSHRGEGIASKMLEHILREANNRGYEILYLETGSQVEFAPARGLYKRYGFVERGPFGDYSEDPNSTFMHKIL